ncbi:hypothetical protein [Natronobacterium texcoconense]|uniref:Uncharacterized protein n=1 Tax=Natronobacterium texcoconense TaxID=1095778 RepID=A0A1H1BTT6_NATTX|nr:hypothetical protein [Natronobacterium texcoconense]SDQ55382.1 hypothetical protein SAMN04489842_1153 [Natronobacterium texcoconense]
MVQSVLFSFTVLFGILLLAGVLGASYAGTMLALKRFFGDEYSERPRTTSD